MLGEGHGNAVQRFGLQIGAHPLLTVGHDALGAPGGFAAALLTLFHLSLGAGLLLLA
ncbi:hypothetical protein D3C84_1123330 [compost metagenome]